MPNSTPNYGFLLPLVNDPTDQDLWGGYLNNNFSALDTLLAAFLTPGVIFPYAGTGTPSTSIWLICNFQAVSRATYANLFTVVGTTYGAGDGSTTFNVPDLRGRLIAGVDNMGGASSANRLNSVLSSSTIGASGGNQNMQSHTHTVSDPGHTHGLNNGANVRSQAAGQGYLNGADSGNTGTQIATATTGITLNTTGSGASQNVQPTMLMQFIIKT